mmetsp:Transcript_15972/g.44323  ORF Transcript_15972/g.44323 Transcript_15972/m.44323 type:complete len:211 (-) Transcript_15972:433-1065(-)
MDFNRLAASASASPLKKTRARARARVRERRRPTCLRTVGAQRRSIGLLLPGCRRRAGGAPRDAEEEPVQPGAAGEQAEELDVPPRKHVQPHEDLAEALQLRFGQWAFAVARPVEQRVHARPAQAPDVRLEVPLGGHHRPELLDVPRVLDLAVHQALQHLSDLRKPGRVREQRLAPSMKQMAIVQQLRREAAACVVERRADVVRRHRPNQP